MKRNSRLSLALHSLGHMSFDADRSQTSAEIAAHAGTNPVVVRRVLGKLRNAGLLTSERGHAGGWKLARPPHKITLADVYMALEESLIASKPEADSDMCSVEQALETRVSKIMRDIETSLIQRLSLTTIADVREAAE
ncbi:transcriptional regulator [Tateyamaria omphalii]|uniref:RrF2 family transcriptional regulator n=1 Tax=Tateyamaria omphalii TaxID=299262 RepID=UPI0016781D02|nr:Rrf2 family transcriptional regulator [Tateyamaria omphalii]GGX66152.1 transcriptional regulator [Tateyamaria omphalii]